MKEIRRLSNPDCWRHVSGSMNPADLPSRGYNPKQLVDSRWWDGPGWLKLSKDQWLSGDYTVNKNEIDDEIRKAHQNKKKALSNDIIMTGTYISILQEIGWYMKRHTN